MVKRVVVYRQKVKRGKRPRRLPAYGKSHDDVGFGVMRIGERLVLVRVDDPDETYTVVYGRSWMGVDIPCPICNRKLFRRNMVSGSLEHKCRGCKNVLILKFDQDRD